MSAHNQSSADFIDVGPSKPRRWRVWLLVAIVIAFIFASRFISIYVSALWFESLGYSSVYWYIFKLKAGLFVVFFILTALLLSATFWLFQRLFGAASFEKRTIVLNNQPFQFSPARVIRPLGWLIAAVVGLVYGLALKDDW